MLTFHVITLFPELIDSYCSTSILGRGQAANRFVVNSYNPRDYCADKYRKVDDSPYGGGAGMVMKPEPIYAVFEALERVPESPVILTSPRGKPFNQSRAHSLAAFSDLTIICGHYEGIDERVAAIVTEEISVGDYVLTGGELPALAIIDSVARLLPGVLGKASSLAHESFVEGLLEPPQYTKPPVFRDMAVPEVLRSGDHKAIAAWRREQALRQTLKRRPDLLKEAALTFRDRQFLEALATGASED